MSKLVFHAIPVPATAIQILAENQARQNALIKNNGSVTVYLHQTSGVTASNGYPLGQGDAMEVEAHGGPPYWAWWAVAASSSGDLRIIEEVSG